MQASKKAALELNNAVIEQYYKKLMRFGYRNKKRACELKRG